MKLPPSARRFAHRECVLLVLVAPALLFASQNRVFPGEPIDWPIPLNRATSAYSGAVTGLAVDAGRVYVSTAGTLAVFDVSDPANPVFLGFDATSGTTQDLVGSDGFAYLVGYHAGLHIHDVSKPSSFSLPAVGMFPVQGAESFSGVGIDGTRVFASGYGADLVVLDCSDPTDPKVLGTAPEDAGESENFYATDIKRVGDRIYMAGGDDDWGAIKIYRDMPGGDPVFLGEFQVIDLPSPPTGVSRRIEVTGDVAYVADSGLGLCLLDVLDPAKPTLIRTIPESSLDLKRAGNLLLLLSSGRLILYDITEPRNPVEFASLPFPTSYGRLAVDIERQTAFVADAGGLLTIDLRDPGNPKQLGYVGIDGIRARDVEPAGDLVYVADAGIRVVDVSDPAAPRVIGSGGDAVHYSLVVDGHKAAAQWENFGIIHLYELGEDGRDPRKVGEVRDSTIQGYDLDEDTLYVAAASDGLQIHGIGNPSNPVRRGEWREASRPVRRVIVNDGLAFVGSSNPGLVVLDVRSPSSPREIGSYQGYSGGWVNAFTIAGSRAYIAESLAFSIVDVSDPANPQRIGAVEAAGSQFVDVTVAGTLAFVMQEGTGDGTLHVIDIQDPRAPVIIRTGVGVDRIERYEARDNLLYLARGYLGLTVLDLTLPRPRLLLRKLDDPLNPIRLQWTAPVGIRFELEGSHNLTSWFPLGRFNGDTLQEALDMLRDDDPSLPGFFRIPEAPLPPGSDSDRSDRIHTEWRLLPMHSSDISKQQAPKL